MLAHHPHKPVPAPIAADARRALLAAARIVSREPGWRAGLALDPAPNWVTLSTKLTFAISALAHFYDLYIDPGDADLDASGS
jgi:hypothetical protein